jgi:hypothetical protein
MAKCTALGVAGAVLEGPCEPEPSIDLAVKLMEQAIDNAQAEASKGCPGGCICKGNGTPVGPPVCYSWRVEEKQYHRWVVTATFDGECECPEGTEKEPKNGEPKPRCGQRFRAEGVSKPFAVRSCDKPELAVDKAALQDAKSKAIANAKKQCPKNCPEVELIETAQTIRSCKAGKLTVTFIGKFVCFSKKKG